MSRDIRPGTVVNNDATASRSAHRRARRADHTQEPERKALGRSGSEPVTDIDTVARTAGTR